MGVFFTQLHDVSSFQIHVNDVTKGIEHALYTYAHMHLYIHCVNPVSKSISLINMIIKESGSSVHSLFSRRLWFQMNVPTAFFNLEGHRVATATFCSSWHYLTTWQLPTLRAIETLFPCLGFSDPQSPQTLTSDVASRFLGLSPGDWCQCSDSVWPSFGTSLCDLSAPQLSRFMQLVAPHQQQLPRPRGRERDSLEVLQSQGERKRRGHKKSAEQNHVIVWRFRCVQRT